MHELQLKPPDKCDACKSTRIKLATNSVVYGKHALDPEYRVYVCLKCRASVGVHEGTDIPLGYMADGKTRHLRMRAHTEFDTLWKYSRMSRSQAYTLLQHELGIDEASCHIGMMSIDQLIQVIEFARHYQSAEAMIKRKREAKKDDRAIKRAERANTLAAFKRRAKRYG